MHELYDDSVKVESTMQVGALDDSGRYDKDSEILVNTALMARIEMLEGENHSLKQKLTSKPKPSLRIEDIAHDDKLVRLYTGFISYIVLTSFYKFLGPAVDELCYWGRRKEAAHKRKRPTKLSPFNQFFLTLVKLRQNLQVRILAHTFNISKSLVSKYVITWITFMYHHLKEIEWIPSAEQVINTMPQSFKEKYPSTLAIIDASEIFIETPSDLHEQSSTWSNYKHHNTCKFLIACTPNSAVSYISSLYVGSISVVKLTKTCGFIIKLEGKSGISVMTDRGLP